MDADQKAQKRRAAEDLAHIERLSTFPPYRDFFLRRITEKQNQRVMRILDTRTSPEETTIEKRIHEAIRTEVLELLETDAAGCAKLLEE